MNSSSTGSKSFFNTLLLLKLTIYQVHRALLYSRTGKYEAPSKKDGEFSRSNWGDIETNNALPGSGKKTIKLTRRATIFKSRIDSLPDPHWKAIIDRARAKVGKRKAARRVSEGLAEAEIIISDEENDDSMLFDSMFA